MATTPFLERLFALEENHTTVRREILGGLTTFLTMAYIVVVNPQILSQAGIPAEGSYSPRAWRQPWPLW